MLCVMPDDQCYHGPPARTQHGDEGPNGQTNFISLSKCLGAIALSLLTSSPKTSQITFHISSL